MSWLESVTVATSPRRMTTPPRSATMTLRYWAAVRSWSLTTTVQERCFVQMPLGQKALAPARLYARLPCSGPCGAGHRARCPRARQAGTAAHGHFAHPAIWLISSGPAPWTRSIVTKVRTQDVEVTDRMRIRRADRFTVGGVGRHGGRRGGTGGVDGTCVTRPRRLMSLSRVELEDDVEPGCFGGHLGHPAMRPGPVPAAWPRWEAMVSGLAPGILACTPTTGKSTSGRGATGSRKKPPCPPGSRRWQRWPRPGG